MINAFFPQRGGLLVPIFRPVGLGGKWAFGVVVWQCAVAWAASLIMHLIGLAVGL